MSIRDRHAGLTLVELLVTMAVAAILMAFIGTLVLSSRNVFNLDTARVSLNENLRSAATVISMDARQSGERLRGAFPAVMIEKGATATTPDILRLRRNVLDVTLPLCKDLKAGSSADAVFVSKKGNGGKAVNADCQDDTSKIGLNTWEDYRVANGGVVQVYIWDPVNLRGEFFDYDAIDGSDQHIHRTTGKWTYDYDAAQFPSPVLYIIEERTYTVDPTAKHLTLAVNGKAPSPVAPNIDSFKVNAYVRDAAGNPVLSAGNFPTSTATWKALAHIQVELGGEMKRGSKTVRRATSYQFTPRNVFSADN